MAQTTEALAGTERPHAASAIGVESVSYRYGIRQVLNQLNLRVHAGEWVAILGESGCGKSTLLRLIAGFDTPDSGSISLFGKNQQAVPPHRRHLAFVTQSAGCYDHLSVSENLSLAARLAPPDPEFEARFGGNLMQQLTEQFQLDRVLACRAAQLSGGERQRLAIARSLLTRRPILLLDEPLAHLNETLRESIRRTMREWTRTLQVTTLYVTHDAIEAMEIADRIAILDQGTIEQIDAPKLVYDAPRTPKVAQLFGRPSIQFFSPNHASQNGTRVTLGVRPVDWMIVRVAENEAIGLETWDSESAPELIGVVAESVRVESNLWLELDAGLSDPIRVIIPASSLLDLSSQSLCTRGTKLRLRARHWHRWPRV